MRKGTVLLFLGKNEDRTECIEFLKEKLNPDKCNFHYGANINDYNIKIFTYYEPNYCRGARSEICYINNSIDINKKYDESYIGWYDVQMKTKLYSNRKEPVRFINSFKDVDLRELLDDDYAMKNTIDKERVNEWNKFIR